MSTESLPRATWAEKFMTSEEIQAVSAAVEKAEALTSGEIVPMIVRRSSTTAHVPWMITLVLLLIFLVFEIPDAQFLGRTHSHWLLLVLAGVSFLLSYPLSRLLWIQRLLVPQSDQIFQVEARALLEFYQSKTNQTKDHTGVLIFISLMERKAVILADEGIAQKLPAETWGEICQNLVKSIGHGRPSDGLIQSIQRSGELLARHFAPKSNTENELSNQLILKE